MPKIDSGLRSMALGPRQRGLQWPVLNFRFPAMSFGVPAATISQRPPFTLTLKRPGS
jgi:hypothetical protein